MTLQKTNQHLQQAMAWLHNGDAQGASLLFSTLISVPHLRGAALAGLGRSQRALGQFEAAIHTYQQALEVAPDSTALTTELAMAQRAAGKLGEAEGTYRQALVLTPHDPIVNHNLGNLLQARGARDEAVACFRQAVQAKPDFSAAWLNLGFLLSDNAPAAAAEALKRGLSLDASSPQALALLAKILCDSGHGADAESCARLAVQLDADYAYGHYTQGLALRVMGRIDEAIEPLARAAKLTTEHELSCECLYLQTLCLKDQGLMSASLAGANALLAQCQTPDQFAKANQLLGALHFEVGDTSTALAHYRRSLELAPDTVPPRVTFCATTNYDSSFDAPAQLAFARKLIGSLPSPGEAQAPHANNQDSNRPLRVGYLSGDFRLHSCAFFLAPLFTHHNREQFHLYAYSTEPVEDAVTARFKGLIPHWRQVHHLNPADLAQLIRADQIDILVDLSGLTDGGRIEAMALKPAPVQIGWLGYLGTTGLSTVDYRLTDCFVDAPGAEAWATEAPLRLPGHYVCFEPPADAPAPTPLPMLRNGYPTFGSFNALSKLSDSCVALWSAVLMAIPNARLLLKTKALTDDTVRQSTLARFVQNGVAADRIELRGWEVTTASHLDLYGQVDVALDTTPYNGVTTTCEAAWQGVPVVSLVGGTFASRQGLTLLTALGLADHAVDTQLAFVGKCQALVGDIGMLEQLRSELRQRMAQGALTAGHSFTIGVESAYRQAWHHALAS